MANGTEQARLAGEATRGAGRFGRRIALVLLTGVTLVLPACHRSDSASPTFDAPDAPAFDAPAPAVSDVISGWVTWPDGTPAKYASIDIFPIGFNYGAETPAIALTTDGDGWYSTNTCAAYDYSNVQAYLDLNSQEWQSYSGALACWILKASLGGSQYGFSAGPGQQFDWQMQDLPCSDTPIEPGGTPVGFDQQGSTIPWQSAQQFLGR